MTLFFSMPFYTITIREAKPGSKRRRKIVTEAVNTEQANLLFTEKSKAIDFVPDFATFKEINRKEYDKILLRLLGKPH